MFLVQVQKSIRLPVGRSSLWPYLSNTDHMNRVVGLPPVRYGPPLDGDLALYREAEARSFGLKLRWREYPFEWVAGQQYAILRDFHSGPVRRFWAGVRLIDQGSDTMATAMIHLEPRWHILRWPLQLAALVMVSKFSRYLQNLASAVARQDDYPMPVASGSKVAPAVLRNKMQELQRSPSANGQVVSRLSQHLMRAPDEEVLHMRPYVLARQWGVERRACLQTFLSSALQGILNVDWELICPNCQVPKQSLPFQTPIPDRFHCDLCETDFETSLDENLELRFSAAPEVRPAEDSVYCIGGPANTPHIFAQIIVPPGAERQLQLELPVANCQIRILRRNLRTDLQRIEAEPSAAEPFAVTVSSARLEPSMVTVGTGLHAWTLGNASSAPVVFSFERRDYRDDAALASEVNRFPEFRRTFGSAILGSGQRVAVRNICLLFTDLKGSTALYEKIGDAEAFMRVSRHFEFLGACIERHGGYVVKTIGDAVMAAFQDAKSGLAACLDMQATFPAWNERQGFDPPLVLKLGLYQGTALAIGANSQSDFFGSTVNLASRTEGQSQGGDVVITADMLSLSGVDSLLRERGAATELFSAQVKGVSQSIALARVTLTR